MPFPALPCFFYSYALSTLLSQLFQSHALIFFCAILRYAPSCRYSTLYSTRIRTHVRTVIVLFTTSFPFTVPYRTSTASSLISTYTVFDTYDISRSAPLLHLVRTNKPQAAILGHASLFSSRHRPREGMTDIGWEAGSLETELDCMPKYRQRRTSDERNVDVSARS